MKTPWLTLAILIGSLTVSADPVIHRVGIRENLEFLEPGRPERMDLYYPADPRPGEKFPGIVIIHGGGWTGGIRNAEREVNIGSNLARMGYVCISIDYRLGNPANLKKYGKIFPVNIQDCKKAVQWLRKHAEELHLDPARIGSIGGSAGGHLSALLALAGPEVGLEPDAPYPGIDTSVQACVNFYGPMDFPGFRDPSYKVGAGRIGVMGSRPEENRKDWLRMSPIEQIDPKDPPMLQIHAKGDTTVPYRQAVIMKEALDKAGVYNELILLEGYGHVFNLQRWRGKPMPPFVRQRVFAFYDRFLKGLSPAQAAERFAALEAFEKKHPEAAHYGTLSVSGGTIEKFDRAGLTILSPDGKRVSFENAFDLEFEKAVRLPVDKMKDHPVFVQGEEAPDGSILCRRIVFSSWRLGRIPGTYGGLRKTADGWALEFNKVRRRLILSDRTAVYETVPARAAEVKPGLLLVGSKARDYGDSRKVFYVLFAEKQQ
ncbi:MAG: alpha/beta hydrolase [Lentisphaeria bacterium]|nr:alpha/beta hydrolase [Lentisphaeria bacterium]